MKNDYRAIKIYDSSMDIKEKILSRFEEKNKGFRLEREVKEEDGIIFIYYNPLINILCQTNQ